MRRLVAEGLVIVTSILLAFAVDAWWDGVQEERARSALVDALVEDFESVRTRLGPVIARERDLEARTEALLAASASQQTLSRDSIQALALGVTAGPDVTPVAPRYRAAVASGEIRLLTRDSLLVALVEFETMGADHSLWREEFLAAFFSGAVHTLRQELGALSVLSPVGGRSEPPRRFLVEDLNEVIQRRSVYAVLEPIHVSRFNLRANLERMDAAAARVLDELEKLRD